MGGFKNEFNNIAFENGFFNLIIDHLYKCSRNMLQECIKLGNKLHNHEDRITDRLVSKQLNLNTLGLRFILQSPETFISSEDQYKGRCDIKVVSKNWFVNSNDYYLIECKRIDGENHLNHQYVTEGVSRFVINPPKYPSYHKRNIMFGYIVKSINVPNNTIKIEQLQKKFLVDVLAKAFVLINSENTEFYHYNCMYSSDTIGTIELAHLFFNFSGVIK